MKYRAVIVAAAAVATLAVACSSGDDDDSAKLDSASSNQESGSDAQQSGGGNSSGDADNPLGSAEGSLPGDPNSPNVPLRVDVTRLERNGDLLELEFAVTLTADSAQTDLAYEPWSTLADPTLTSHWDISGVSLIDGAAKRAYLPVLDSEEVCVCTGNLSNTSIGPGESMRLSATYGGVPEDASRLDVHVPGFTAITGLPIGG